MNLLWMSFSLLCLLSQSCVIAMNATESQYELCAGRNTSYARKITEERKAQADQTDQKKSEGVTKPCVFCDEKILKTNFIIDENTKNNVRVMMNKFPYPSFDQGIHLLIMPITHREHPDDLANTDFIQQIDAAHEVSKKLHDTTYSQEYFTNWGAIAGQSVPHWHSQLKNFVKPPLSLPEKIKDQEAPRIATIEGAFAAVKAKLETEKSDVSSQNLAQPNVEQCLCCSVKEKGDVDRDNFVVARFKHNYVCVSHYPRWPGELSVVPYRHVPSIQYLSQEELRENMIIAKTLLPIMTQYTQDYIRDCSGGNLYTKSMGGKTSSTEQSNYHVHTTVIPRTVIAMTPGTVEGNSCKLDFNPVHLTSYLRDKSEELQKTVNN
jgi:galactose-1-phosphate uridylyltransferase